jgi:hypothetical protein
MDYAIEEIEPDVWRVDIAGTTRIVRYRRDLQTFAPWDICTADGRRLWGSPSLESAFRWIQARTGHPTEGILVEGLLEQTGTHRTLAHAESPALASEVPAEGDLDASPRRA